MTRDDIVGLVARLDPGAKVGFTAMGRAKVLASALMAGPALDQLLKAVPDTQVAFGFESPLWADMRKDLAAARPTGPGYDLDDLNEDGSWKPGRRPAGWGAP